MDAVENEEGLLPAVRLDPEAAAASEEGFDLTPAAAKPVGLGLDAAGSEDLLLPDWLASVRRALGLKEHRGEAQPESPP